MADEKHACFGVSVKIWLTRRKFYWLPRMGPKYVIIPRGKSRNIKHTRPYGAWIFVWLWLDVVLYFPKAVNA